MKMLTTNDTIAEITNVKDWEYQFQKDILELEMFVNTFRENVQNHSKVKRSIYEDETRMVSCFDYIINGVILLHDSLPFYKSAVELIEQLMADKWQKHSDNKEKGIASRGDWFNVKVTECGDILIAILDGYEREYGF